MSNQPPPPPQYQPYQPPQHQYAHQLQPMQLQRHQMHAQPAEESVVMKRVKMCAMGFAMGAIVGSTVVGLHSIMNRLPRSVAIKNAASTGMAFGTIFAVGTFIRPV